MRFPRKGDEMPLYLVSYDIAEQHGDEYKPLWTYLDTLGSLKVLYSEYAVPFSRTPLELATQVNKYLKKEDHLLLSEMFNSSATTACTDLLVDRKVFFDFLARHARSLS